jgi:hypothetical protein
VTLRSGEYSDEPGEDGSRQFKQIAQTTRLVLRGSGYSTETDARGAGEQWRDAVTASFARRRIGADFGDRAAHSFTTDAGIAMLEAQYGGRVLNDTHGLMVFECEPPATFTSSSAIVTVGRGADGFADEVRAAHEARLTLSAEERLAFDLFSVSNFGVPPDARFMLLMMALETLAEPKQRSDAARDHVNALIEATRTSALPEGERDSLIGALAGLRRESSAHACRRLAETLTPKQYMETGPIPFFNACYRLRGKLVHGEVPRPSRDEVGLYAVNLEGFIADLLARPLANLGAGPASPASA